MKTLAQLKEAVYARGFEDDQDERIAGFANDVVEELFNDHRWRFAQSVDVIPATAGTGPYALPTGTLHVESVRLTYADNIESPELTPISADDMLEYVLGDPSNAQAGGTAVWAQTDEGVLTVWPAPTGGTLTVRTQRVHVEVEDDADTLDVPDSLFGVVVLGVCVRLAERERKWEDASTWQGKFDARLGRVKAQIGLGQRQNAGRVGRSGDKMYGGY